MERFEVLRQTVLALASTVFLFMAGFFIPPVGVVLMPFVTQPVLSFGIRNGTSAGMGVLAAATIILIIFAGKDLGYIYFVCALMAGLLFALLGRLRSIEILVVGIAVSMFMATTAISVVFFGSWAAMINDFRESITQHFTAATRVYEKMGLSQESLALLKEQTPQIVELMLQILPALGFLIFAFVVLINILFLCRRFPERRSQWLAMDNFRAWKGPEFLVWGLIACGFALFLPGLQLLRILALNVLLVIGACYFAQGLAVVAYFFHKNNVPRFLRGVTYVLIVFQQIFTLLVVGLGLFDLWGDFRRLKKNDLTSSHAG
jgi:uncharacterized protein YybS (DUF2232 family)